MYDLNSTLHLFWYGQLRFAPITYRRGYSPPISVAGRISLGVDKSYVFERGQGSLYADIRQVFLEKRCRSHLTIHPGALLMKRERVWHSGSHQLGHFSQRAK